jgi:hypothetical protein
METTIAPISDRQSQRCNFRRTEVIKSFLFHDDFFINNINQIKSNNFHTYSISENQKLSGLALNYVIELIETTTIILKHFQLETKPKDVLVVPIYSDNFFVCYLCGSTLTFLHDDHLNIRSHVQKCLSNHIKAITDHNCLYCVSNDQSNYHHLNHYLSIGHTAQSLPYISIGSDDGSQSSSMEAFIEINYINPYYAVQQKYMELSFLEVKLGLQECDVIYDHIRYSTFINILQTIYRALIKSSSTILPCNNCMFVIGDALGLNLSSIIHSILTVQNTNCNCGGSGALILSPAFLKNLHALMVSVPNDSIISSPLNLHDSLINKKKMSREERHNLKSKLRSDFKKSYLLKSRANFNQLQHQFGESLIQAAWSYLNNKPSSFYNFLKEYQTKNQQRPSLVEFYATSSNKSLKEFLSFFFIRESIATNSLLLITPSRYSLLDGKCSAQLEICSKSYSSTTSAITEVSTPLCPSLNDSEPSSISKFVEVNITSHSSPLFASISLSSTVDVFQSIQDHYNYIGLSQDSSPRTLHRHYSHLKHKYHPDNLIRRMELDYSTMTNPFVSLENYIMSQEISIKNAIHKMNSINHHYQFIWKHIIQSRLNLNQPTTNIAEDKLIQKQKTIIKAIETLKKNDQAMRWAAPPHLFHHC